MNLRPGITEVGWYEFRFHFVGSPSNAHLFLSNRNLVTYNVELWCHRLGWNTKCIHSNPTTFVVLISSFIFVAHNIYHKLCSLDLYSPGQLHLFHYKFSLLLLYQKYIYSSKALCTKWCDWYKPQIQYTDYIVEQSIIIKSFSYQCTWCKIIKLEDS